MNKFIFFLGLVLFSVNTCYGATESLRALFKNNEAIIYALNIRNFGAYDKDKDGIITPSQGDISGTFLNAKPKLKDLATDGINVIYVFPITKTGKLKALGTAGSLYAMDSFNQIDPKLDDTANDKTVYEEAREFIEEAHKFNMKVILDLPSCGSYDLSLNKPNWFIHDEEGESVVPADWTDVRLFKVYNKDNTLNEAILNNFKSFFDMAINLGFDGVRADVAAIKPPEFWKNIIDYTRNKNEDFLFIAEASPDWSNPAEYGVPYYSSIDDLLKAGFDAYYGSWSDFKSLKTKAQFDEKINKNLKILSKNKDKSIMNAVATHDQQAPILRSKNYWDMILWLSVTLPQNSYFLDGFSVGDDYTYDYENQKAFISYTDDEYYYVHSGLFDIFNYTAPVRALHPEFRSKYLKAVGFKKTNKDLYKNGTLKLLKTNNDKIFSYSLSTKERELVVIGSFDENENQKASVQSDYLKNPNLFSIINGKNKPKIIKNKIETELEPLEIQVYLITKGKQNKEQ